jgi:hypothetical protein
LFIAELMAVNANQIGCGGIKALCQEWLGHDPGSVNPTPDGLVGATLKNHQEQSGGPGLSLPPQVLKPFSRR